MCHAVGDLAQMLTLALAWCTLRKLCGLRALTHTIVPFFTPAYTHDNLVSLTSLEGASSNTKAQDGGVSVSRVGEVYFVVVFNMYFKLLASKGLKTKDWETQCGMSI